MVPLNTFSAVTVHGFMLKNGTPITQTFQRGTSRPGTVWVIDPRSSIQCEGLPPRPPSNLPPPGNQHLSIALGEPLGNGRVGTVHSAKLLTHETDLPPLVVKISRHKRSENMEIEAWFYEEVETIQGTSVPRCYGLFQTHLEEGAEVSTWKEGEYRSKNNSEGDPTLLSILLLERLGGKMPMGQTDYTAIEADVYEIYEDLGRLGIEHLDIRWSNILSVDQGSKHVVCPNHGHAHQWRIVDFDFARKTNGTVDFLSRTYNGYLKRIFVNAPYDCVVEPWE